MKRSLTYVTALAAAVGGLTLARVAAQEPEARFSSKTDLVVLHVNVFDGRSDAVEDLPQSAFTVLEDGQPQEIQFFTGADVPVAAGLLIDNSGSMITRRDMVIAGMRAFVESSHPEDDLFTFIFNERVINGLPNGVPFTRNHNQLTVAVTRFPAGGRTALYDAVIAALDYVKDAPLQKRVLIVLSDGEDTASRSTKADMLKRVADSDAIIYAIAKDDYASGSAGAPAVMRTIANASGGMAYFPKTEQEVVKDFSRIATNIRRGYSIGYVPKSGTDSFHEVKVLVRAPGRNNLTARVRHGYGTPRPVRPE